MSLIDKAMSAVMPLESEEKRAEARRKAQACAQPGDWLSMILDHHRQLESLFAEALSSADAGGRQSALRKLAILLNGHALAEEVVLYPNVADSGHKAHAKMAYDEQAMTKTEMALLEKLDPMSQEWTDKLEHIRDAVAHHMYQEESDWFIDLAREAPDQAMMTKRYREEFERYTGGSGESGKTTSEAQSQPMPA